MPDTIEPIELVFTGLMIFGLATSFSNWLWARERLIELHRAGENGVLHALRGGAVADQFKILAVFACLVVIGFVSLLIPTNPRTEGIAQVAGWMILTQCLILIWLSVSVRMRPERLRIQFRLRTLEERQTREEQAAQDKLQDEDKHELC